jgi:hypothetical protein
MVVSSHAALNKIDAGGRRELKEYITHMLDPSNERTEAMAMPTGLHFVVADRNFMGTNQPNFSCPIRSIQEHKDYIVNLRATKAFKSPLLRSRDDRCRTIRGVKTFPERYREGSFSIFGEHSPIRNGAEIHARFVDFWCGKTVK